MNEPADEDPGDVLGTTTDAAVEAVLAGADAEDREVVRTVLETVSEDGVVSGEALEAELSETAMTVSTVETRTELAVDAFEEYETAAADAPDVELVATRTAEYRERLDGVESDADRLGDRLEDLVERWNGDANAFDVARGIAELRDDATELQGRADELQSDLQEGREWLDSSETRFQRLESDVAAFEETLDEFGDAIDELEEMAPSQIPGVGQRAPTAWFDLTVSHRSQGLFFPDARNELAYLRAWAEQEGADPGRGDDVAADIDDLEDRWATQGDRLEAVARPEWTDAFEDRLAGLEETLEAYEPPIDWTELSRSLVEFRPGIQQAPDGD